MTSPKIFHRAFERTLPGATSASRWLDGIGAAEDICGNILFAMQICLEELFSNIVRHGGPASSSPPEIFVTLEIHPCFLRMIVEDDGKPFDVSKARAEKISRPLAGITPGGLGVLLAKSYADKLTYERSGGLNIVTAEFARRAGGSYFGAAILEPRATKID